MSEKAWNRILGLLPYLASLYYLELIYLLAVTAVMLGRLPAFIMVMALALVLAWHLSGLAEGRRNHRIPHLLLMDIHIAYVIASLAGTLWNGMKLSGGDTIFLSLRTIMAVLEIPYVVILTGPRGRQWFGEEENVSPSGTAAN